MIELRRKLKLLLDQYDRMVERFNEMHRRAKHLKKDIQRKRVEISEVERQIDLRK